MKRLGAVGNKRKDSRSDMSDFGNKRKDSRSDMSDFGHKHLDSRDEMMVSSGIKTGTPVTMKM